MRNFTLPQLPLVVYTDLDATLLDHDNYSHDAAIPAVEKLKSLNIPLIPVSSKTLTELHSWAKSIGFNHPMVAENGSTIAIPKNYFADFPGTETDSGMQVWIEAESYAEIIAVLKQLRSDYSFQFTGFNDMSDKQVAEITGLTLDIAAQARQRHSSEALIWQGDAVSFEVFKEKLADHSLTLAKGGRFWHVMGKRSKGMAIQELDALYMEAGFSQFTTIALGDSENDISMLRAVDIPVLIKKKDGSYISVNGIENINYSDEAGPAGWNEFILNYLKTLEQDLSGK